MSNDINLLYTKKPGQLGRLTRKVKLFRFIALSFLSVVALISVIVFILVLASPLPKLKEEEASLASQLNADQAKITKHILLSKRLTEASTIIEKRSQYDDTLELFEKDLPASVVLAGFNADENIIKLRLSSSTLDGLQTYMDTLSAFPKSKLAKTVSLSSLVTDETQGFIVNVTIEL